MNVTSKLSLDEMARACADAMWAEDDASKGLGMEIVEVGPGRATLAMTVKPHMVNGQRIAHGGFIFTLADSAFAFACNSHNERVVAAQGNITFIRPGLTSTSAMPSPWLASSCFHIASAQARARSSGEGVALTFTAVSLLSSGLFKQASWAGLVLGRSHYGVNDGGGRHAGFQTPGF